MKCLFCGYETDKLICPKCKAAIPQQKHSKQKQKEETILNEIKDLKESIKEEI